MLAIVVAGFDLKGEESRVTSDDEFDVKCKMNGSRARHQFAISVLETFRDMVLLKLL